MKFTICERCDEPCGSETLTWNEKHGMDFPPYEQWSEDRSDCCGAETYELESLADNPNELKQDIARFLSNPLEYWSTWAFIHYAYEFNAPHGYPEWLGWTD